VPKVQEILASDLADPLASDDPERVFRPFSRICEPGIREQLRGISHLEPFAVTFHGRFDKIPAEK
jgi:hypothetical protein